jgi:hypothetical protein
VGNYFTVGGSSFTGLRRLARRVVEQSRRSNESAARYFY